MLCDDRLKHPLTYQVYQEENDIQHPSNTNHFHNQATEEENWKELGKLMNNRRQLKENGRNLVLYMLQSCGRRKAEEEVRVDIEHSIDAGIPVCVNTVLSINTDNGVDCTDDVRGKEGCITKWVDTEEEGVGQVEGYQAHRTQRGGEAGRRCHQDGDATRQQFNYR